MLTKMKYEMTSLFILGVIFSFLSHLADVIKENPYKDATKLRICFIMLSRSVFGGIIAVIIYYGLVYYYVDMSAELKIALSSGGAFMSEQISLLLITLIKKKVEK